MRKIINKFSLVSVFTAMVLLVCLAACNDDDKKGGGSSNGLEGTWVVKVCTHPRYWNGATVKFSSGGKITVIGDVWGSGSDVDQGTYKATSSKLTINFEDEIILTGEYDIDGDVLSFTYTYKEVYGSSYYGSTETGYMELRRVSGGNTGNYASKILGTWKRTASWGYETMTFNKNGKGTYAEHDYYYSSGYDDIDPFSWSIKDDRLVLRFGDEDETYIIMSLDSDTMELMYYDPYDSYYGSSYGSIQTWKKQ